MQCGQVETSAEIERQPDRVVEVIERTAFRMKYVSCIGIQLSSARLGSENGQYTYALFSASVTGGHGVKTQYPPRMAAPYRS